MLIIESLAEPPWYQGTILARGLVADGSSSGFIHCLVRLRNYIQGHVSDTRNPFVEGYAPNLCFIGIDCNYNRTRETRTSAISAIRVAPTRVSNSMCPKSLFFFL